MKEYGVLCVMMVGQMLMLKSSVGNLALIQMVCYNKYTICLYISVCWDKVEYLMHLSYLEHVQTTPFSIHSYPGCYGAHIHYIILCALL